MQWIRQHEYFIKELREQTGIIRNVSGEWWKAESRLDRLSYGVADRVDRIKAIGNGQCPQTAAIAFKYLMYGEKQ